MGSRASASDVPPLPQPRVSKVAQGITLLEPLSRKGVGPGLILLTPPGGDSLDIKVNIPSVLVKWAEEGYTVVQLGREAFEAGKDSPLQLALKALSDCSKCEPKNEVGLVSYEPDLWDLAAPRLSSTPSIVAAVSYADSDKAASLAKSPIPIFQHLAGKAHGKLVRSDSLTVCDYPTTSTHLFATPFGPAFDYAAEGVSHTRSLTHLKKHMHGPYFDLEAIWDEHTYWEFENRNVEQTMATMVQEPYVNHVPTMTGGIGRADLTHFYTNHFIFSNPDDTALETISRTIGIDRVIDEFIYKFTHDREVFWMVPGVPPTGKYIEVPMTAVVNIRGDRLYHEHIAWDNASVLRQLGLLPEYLEYPYPVDGKKGWEYKVPVAGAQTAEKMRDKNAVTSNEMFEFRARKVGETK